MKFRDGFVSNSSTTSYLIYGWKIEKKMFYDIEHLLDEHDIDYFEDEYEENTLIGHHVTSSYNAEVVLIDESAIAQAREEGQEMKKLLDLDIEPQLWLMGSYPGA